MYSSGSESGGSGSSTVNSARSHSGRSQGGGVECTLVDNMDALEAARLAL